jgi:glycosyltransferase involved in cell wall biosynthesis
VRVLLLSAYDAASHQHWYRQLMGGMPHWDWTLLTLAPRYFSWRIRGNSLSWAFNERETLQRPYDLVLATSMTDLSALRGLVPALAQVPTLVYFHENQFAYPESERAFKAVEPKILNIYTALAADRVLFNSAYNRDSFLAGAAALLKKLPDQVPSGIVARLRERSAVLPVPLADSCFEPGDAGDGFEARWNAPVAGACSGADSPRPLRLLWSARWEYDKGPRRLLAILQALEARQLDYRLCLLGQSFRHTPAEFAEIGASFGHRLVQFGFAETRAEYQAWLRSADLVLSTAEHEFQGLAVLEALAAGCLPVLPNRLVYPELVPASGLYASVVDDLAAEAGHAADLIERQACVVASAVSSLRINPAAVPLQLSLQRFAWRELKPAYEAEMLALAHTGV